MNSYYVYNDKNKAIFILKKESNHRVLLPQVVKPSGGDGMVTLPGGHASRLGQKEGHRELGLDLLAPCEIVWRESWAVRDERVCWSTALTLRQK